MIGLAGLLGLVVGAVIGGLGGGGGVLTVPALVYVLGRSAQDATTGSVVIVGVTAAAGVLARARSGEVSWRTGLMFGAVGIPAALLGTALNHRVGQSILLLAFAGLTLVTAAAMLLDARATRRGSGRAGQDGIGEHGTDEGVGDEHPEARQLRASRAGATGADVATATRTRGARVRLVSALKIALFGAAVGFLTGFLGVGGGFLVVPALVLVLRMPMRPAIGTSLLVIALNSVASMISRVGVAELDWGIIVPFTLAAVTGTFVGKRVTDRLPERTRGIAFAWLLVAVGLFVGVQNLLTL